VRANAANNKESNMKIEIEIPEVSRDEVLAAVSQKLVDDHAYDREVMRIVREQIPVLVEHQFTAAIKEQIAAAVADVVANGWQKTDGYGSPKGDRMSLGARIGEFLEHRTAGYGEESRTINVLIKTAVTDAVRGEFDPIIAEAKKVLASRLDAEIMAGVARAITEAVGLRRA
jgi:hypothetical protein